MGLAGKLKDKTAEAETAVNHHLCQTKNCGGTYIVRSIYLTRDNGMPLCTVCYRVVCVKCGRAKKMFYNGKNRDVMYYYDGFRYYYNPMNFPVPRELIEKPVYDKNGVPVLDAGGKQIMSFEKELKKDFLGKLFSLINPKTNQDQYFSLSQVMNAKIKTPAS